MSLVCAGRNREHLGAIGLCDFLKQEDAEGTEEGINRTTAHPNLISADWRELAV